MPTTLNHQITYPSGSSTPNVPLAMQTLAESVDAAIEDLNTDWVTVTSGFPGTWVPYTGGGAYVGGLRYRKVGDNVQLQAMLKSGAAGSIIFTLPVGFRPTVHEYMQPVEVNGAGTLGMIHVSVSGNITYRAGVTTPLWININTMFPIN